MYFTAINHLKLKRKETGSEKSHILPIFFQFWPQTTPQITQKSSEWAKNNLFYPWKPFKSHLEQITSKKISAIFDHF